MRDGRLRRRRFAGIYPQMNTPCYCAALRAAARKTTALYDEALAPAGIGVAQFSLMQRIRGAGASVSLTELARLSELDRSTVGRNVKVLVRMGLLAETAVADQRETAVALTEAGRGALRRAWPLWQATQARVEAALGEVGAQSLRALALTL